MRIHRLVVSLSNSELLGKCQVAQNKNYTLAEIAATLRLRLIGDDQCEIHGVGSLKRATPGQLSFLSNHAYIGQLPETKASAVIVEKRFADLCQTNVLLSDNPYVSFAQSTALFKTSQNLNDGIHDSAVIDKSAVVDKSVCIGPNVIVEADALIASGSVIGANSYVGEGAVIGKNCHLNNNVTIYHQVKLGESVIIHSGAVVGADGFGFAFNEEKYVKIYQLGSVLIGNNVEIGACTTIDRGTLEDTIIGEGVKIDNQVQIGHNCKVGKHSVICGCTGIAGSVSIGEYCMFGGASGAVGHISITDKVQVSAMSLVSESITEPGVYSSGTWHMKTSAWKRNNIRFKQLDSISKRVRELEKSQKKE